jgi:hypothetical protein
VCYEKTIANSFDDMDKKVCVLEKIQSWEKIFDLD